MLVNSEEQGDRPPLLTKARMQAPAAKRAFVALLSQMEWADYAFVVLDWEGAIALAPGEILDKPRPIMYLQVVKAMPQYGGSVVVEHNIDIDDVFGGNEIETDDIVSLVVSLKETVEERVEAVRAGGNT